MAQAWCEFVWAARFAWKWANHLSAALFPAERGSCSQTLVAVMAESSHRNLARERQLPLSDSHNGAACEAIQSLAGTHPKPEDRRYACPIISGQKSSNET
jgi:hypothetical protein